MSRCTIKTTSPVLHHLEVGFDRPMACYFGHAYNAADDAVDSLWRTDHVGLVTWMKKHQVDLTDTETKAVYDTITQDLDPGDYGDS